MIASTSLTGARRTGPTALRVCFGSGAGTVHSAPRDQVTVAALLQDRSSCKPSPTACIGARTIPTYTLTATVSSSHLSAHTSLQRWTRQADGRSRPARAPGAGRVPRADCGVPHTGIQGRHSPNQVAWSRTRLPGAPMRMRGPGSARSTSRPPVPRPGGAGRLVRRRAARAARVIADAKLSSV